MSIFKVLLALIVSIPLSIISVDLPISQLNNNPAKLAASITPSSTVTTTVTATTGAEEWIVPVVRSTPDARGNVIHVVQQGQSLWMIAIAYGTKINNILSLNNLPLDTKTLYNGQRLLMPVSLTPQATATLETITSPTASPVPTQMATPSPVKASPDIAETATPDQDEQAIIDERFRGGLFIALVVGVVLIVGGLLVSRR
ncbi:MAG: LysM peptidoglycan-binding domain-containing protein [Anaerolineae bacterium]|nr:LysM peptidoglycan-binding domain-containing protein [Anaerolineae bacterium]